MDSLKPAVEVFVFLGDRFLGSRCFQQSTITIGSDPEATLRLRDANIEARHAVLRLEGGHLVIASSARANGVLVNGEAIDVRRVGSVDEVRLGPFRLKVSLLGGRSTGSFVATNADDGARRNVDEDAATRVRRLSDLEGAPLRAQPRGTPQPQPRAGGADLDPFPAGEPVTVPRGRSLAPARPSVDRFLPAAQAVAPPQAEPAAQARAVDPAFRPAAGPSWPDTVPDAPLTHQAGDRAQPSAGSASATRPQSSWPPESTSASAFDDDASADHGEDDDDDDASFSEPFSLLESVVRERFASPVPTDHVASAEVIRYRDGQLLDVVAAPPGANVFLDPDGFRLLSVSGDGQAILFFRRDFGGTVVRGGKAYPLGRLAQDGLLVDAQREHYAIQLHEGDYAQIVRPDAGHLVRFVRAPRLPPPRRGLGLSWGSVQVFAASLALHFLTMVLVGFASPESSMAIESEVERFAKVSLKDLELEKQAEAPPKAEEPPPPAPDNAPAPPPKAEPKVRQRVASRPGPVNPQPRAQVQQQRQVASVLSALENIRPSGGPGRADLSSLVTNIAAVRVPGGAGASFKVSGVIGKIPGGGIRLAGGLGGGGGRETRGGSQLLAGSGGVGSITALAGTGSRVRGRATKAPTRAISATGGFLSREAIQRVVSEHMATIQACYERQLLVNRGLAGKIVFDWVINPAGRVDTARQVSSSVADFTVSTCILSQIRSWVFPQPVGGSVTVRYPFVFRVQGF
ncbi:MAG: AgmX/PglI C-terminal domain-containing protein [Proteobacteria bacterium]|nr:AgmX/PglI C-terminal domain-containing protein [Pseudomonadota bacterium]